MTQELYDRFVAVMEQETYSDSKYSRPCLNVESICDTLVVHSRITCIQMRALLQEFEYVCFNGEVMLVW